MNELKNCQWCNKKIDPLDGKPTGRLRSFCSAKCRDDYHNEIRRVNQEIDRAINHLDKLKENLTRGKRLANLSLEHLQLLATIAAQLTDYKAYCGICGQSHMLMPKLSEKCQFCGNSAWFLKIKVIES